MPKILKTTPKASKIISDLFYVLLNVILVIATIASVRFFDAPWISLALILIGKWRIFSVKIRFWWANIVSNFTDVIVGIGYVFILYYLNSAVIYWQLAWGILYLAWLLVVKQGSGKKMVMAQGLAAVLLSDVILSIYGYELHIIGFLLIEFFVGYNVMQHFLTNCDFDSKYVRLMSGIWGVIMMELAWIYWHWLIGYDFAGVIRISQFAITSTLVTFVAYKVLNYVNEDSANNRSVLKTDLIVSISMSVLLITIMLLFFSKPVINI